jgi:hypothetical protein
LLQTELHKAEKMTTASSLLEVGSGSEAMYRPFNDEDEKIKKGNNDSSMSWYDSLRTAVLGNGAVSVNRPEQKQRKV